MYRTKRKTDRSFRAPQFAANRGADANAVDAAAAELAALFAPAAEPDRPTATIVVRKRRVVPAVDAPSASTPAPTPAAAAAPVAPAAPASQPRRPRVFALEQRPQDAPAPDAAATPEPSPQAAADAPARPARRRGRPPLPESMRPGEVVVQQPPRPAPAAAPAVSLAALERELTRATRTLEQVAAAARQWEFDLTIHARWNEVDRALDALKARMAVSRTASLARAGFGALPRR
jgi:hypothetical protein